MNKTPSTPEQGEPSTTNARRAGVFGLVAALLCVCSIASAQATAVQPSPAQKSLKIAVFAGLDGHFFDPNCRSNRTADANFAHIVGEIEAKRTSWKAASGQDMITVGVGDVLGTGALGRYALQRRGEGAHLAEALKQLNPALIGIGNGELSVQPKLFRNYVRAIRKAGLRIGTANLSCSVTGDVACGDQSQHQRVISTGSARIGLYTLQYDDLEDKVEPDHLKGLQFTDPADATYEAISDLEDAGAELIVGVVHRGSHGAPEEEMLQMAEVLRGRVHLLITDAVAQGSSVPRVVRVGEGKKSITVVSVRGGRAAWYEIDVRRGADGRITDARVFPHHPTKKSPIAKSASSWLQSIRKDYCREWSKPIGKFKLAAPLDFAGFIALSLHVMRSAAAADVSFINRGAFDTRHAFPMKDAITLDDLNRVFRFPNKIQVFKVDGETLESYLAADPGEDGGNKDLHFLGAEVTDDDTVMINGRPLDYELTYTVATIDFLAHGGDSLIEPVAKSKVVTDGKTKLLLDHVRLWLLRHSGNKVVRPEAEFADLWDRPLWRLKWDTRTELSTSKYNNPAGYQDVRLTNLNARNLDIFADIGLRMNTRDHGWSNRLLVDYSQTVGTDTTFTPPAEYRLVNSDELRGETSYEFRYLRDTMMGKAWWAPLLVAYARMRTEFDVPTTQKYRQFDIEALAGLAWELGPKLEVRVGAGGNRELLRIDPGPYNRMMFAFGFFLERYPVVEVYGTQLYLQMEGDIRIKGPGTDNRQEFYSNNMISFEILGPLEFYGSVEVFGLRADGPFNDFIDRTTGQPLASRGDFAYQLQTAFGLRLKFVTSLQQH